MPVRARKVARSSRSQRFGAFCDDILANAPGVSVVEFRHRDGTHGRYQQTPFDYVCSDEERADPQRIIEGVTGVLGGFDDEQGPGLTFEARFQVTVNAETKSCGPYRFKLDDDEDSDSPEKLRIEGMMRTLEKAEKMLHRAWAREESTLERAGNMLGPVVELRRMENDHKEKMRAYDVEEKEDEHLFGVIQTLGPQWLVTQAAKRARDKGFGDGQKRALWKRLVTVAGIVIERDEVKEVLGEKGTDLVEQIAVARTEKEVEVLLNGIKGLNPPIDPVRLVHVANELLPFADLMMGDAKVA